MPLIESIEFSNQILILILVLERKAMIPITSMNIERGQVIMAGDPIQLPPITLSNHARHLNLDKSMLERYLEIYGRMDGVIPVK